MSGWQVGDLAVCVDDSTCEQYLVRNCIYTVRFVKPLYLYLDGIFAESGSGLDGFRSFRFRKIKPDTEGANEDDAAWLKGLLAKPKVQVQP